MDAIIASAITKTYRIGVGRARIREMLPRPLDGAVRRMFPRWWARDTFDALSDVSLNVPAGSAFGLVGHNGAGKTTLLKVIAGVTAPARGKVTVNGRVAALIDVLIGFHPDLTGRENVPLLGAMHGIRRRTMAQRIDRILEFAEISELADTPIKRFSAGMAGRLGFATITELDADILLIDEVLSVGDAAFQRKCINWLDGFRRRGGTLLFVSHNLGLVRSMTDQVVWLDHGKVVEEGPTAAVLARYAGAMERRDQGPPMMRRRREASKVIVASGMHRWGAGGARVDEVHIEDPLDGELGVQITYTSHDLDRAYFCVGFLDEAGQDVGTATSPATTLEPTGRIRCSIRPVPLRPGIYFPVIAIVSDDGTVHDRWRLDRGVVIEPDGGPALGEEFGRIAIGSSWGNGAVPDGEPHRPSDPQSALDRSTVL